MRSTSRKRRSNLRLAFCRAVSAFTPRWRERLTVANSKSPISSSSFASSTTACCASCITSSISSWTLSSTGPSECQSNPTAEQRFWILWARIRAGRLSGMSSSAECWDFSARSALLICSQRASTSALLPAVASPKICGWRRSSLSLMAAQISSKLKRPSSCAICA